MVTRDPVLRRGLRRHCSVDTLAGSSPRSANETHRVMPPLQFLARLAALIPPPRHPLIRFYGIFAPRSPRSP